MSQQKVLDSGVKKYEQKQVSMFKKDYEEILETYLRKKNRIREIDTEREKLMIEIGQIRKKWKFVQEYEGRLSVSAKKQLDIDNRTEKGMKNRKKKNDARKEKVAEKKRKYQERFEELLKEDVDEEMSGEQSNKPKRRKAPPPPQPKAKTDLVSMRTRRKMKTIQKDFEEILEKDGDI